jgi:gluconolactonase
MNRREETTMWQPNERYPDAAVRVLDKEFLKYRLPLASVERLYTGCRWSEGAVYVGDGRYVLWSDIPNNRVLRWDEETGNVSIYRKPSNNTNGHTRDRQGRLVWCEHDARRVVRCEYDGTHTVIADSYNRKPLNSPNDVVVKSDGSIWFTDPTFGISGYYEGHKAESEIKPAVYRVDGKTGKITMILDDVAGPNGLAFSPDEKKLYVVASRAEPNRTIVAYDVLNGTKVGKGKVLIDAGKGGSPDGFRVDIDGNLWCGWGMGTPELDGVRIFNPEGAPIGHISLPERSANVCFGGPKRNRLFMAASHSVYALYVNTQGVKGG